MQLNSLDWLIVATYFGVVLVVGLYFARRAGRGSEEFFASGRALPWWLLGTSMVATTFSTDTPNLVTDIVRTQGVFGNWTWWAFLITGMCTVFLYARLWRRSGVLTDMGFYELRYSGRMAAFLRGFRAVYLGLFFNVMIMATVTLAAVKIAGILLGLDPVTTVVVCGLVTAVYSATSGLWGVVATDLLLFFLSMAGSLAAAWYALARPEVGGLTGLLAAEQLDGRLALVPDFDRPEVALSVLVIPLAIQWWSVWYPGAEPGGGGYIAQRMLAARDERHAVAATLWFNVAHYALRPWPWILVALASLIVYPSVDSIATAFPDVDPSILAEDLAYPAMLVFLPHGLLGLVLASLAAAYMSTISTHLNWGASYLVEDVYRRFFRPSQAEGHYVAVARLTTVLLIGLAGLVSLWLQSALQAFEILLQIGAGTGSIFLLRWFWWRVNAYSELSGMIISFVVALYFEFAHASIFGAPLAASFKLVIGVAVTTVGWVVVTLLTPPDDADTLRTFVRRIRPAGPGWAAFREPGQDPGSLTPALAAWFLGVLGVYSALFGTGFLLYGNLLLGLTLYGLFALSGAAILKVMRGWSS